MKRPIMFLVLCLATLMAMGQSSYEKYIEKAKQGDAKAQFEVGYSYRKGDGVAKDNSQAVYWYRKSADQGYADGQNKLGFMYDNGYGVTQDYSQAVYWYRKAADQGNMFAQNNLGFMYENGYGVTKDYSQAVYWYRKSAEQGCADAQYGLGSRYYLGEGVPKDYAQAVYWYQKAAAQGHEMAKTWLPKAEAKLAEQNLASNNQPKTTVTSTPQSVQQTTAPVKQTPTPVQTPVSDVDKSIPSVGKADPNTFAVIIGNEHYKNESDVPFAENDAKVFKQYVQKTLGVPEKQIYYVANASLNDLRGAIRWLSQAMDLCDGQGRAIFYYAGHGIPDEDEKTAYLLPIDGYGIDVESGYSLSRLYAELGKMPAQRVAVFLDACFSGAKREGGMLASARGVAIKAKYAEPVGKLVVFTAAQEDETAFPYKEKQHGMFTYYLLKKLQDTRGEATLGELGDYLTKEVKRQSFIENKKMQTPTVTSRLGSWRSMKLK